jgi:tetratricopeptide (TPR) repeat protein
MPHIPPRIVSSTLWTLSFTAVLGWVAIAGHHHWWRASLLTGLAAATFVIGALVGFVFTTYDEESSTIGKVKDWLIGSLAAITLVKFGALKPVLLAFTLHKTDAEFALTLSVAIVFAGLGFLFMFFGRELLFNVPLARERAARNRIETGQAGLVTIQLLSALPSSILIGIDDAEDLLKNRPEEAATLKAQLWSPEVNTFLRQSDDGIANGVSLGWDVVSKNAYLQYYRTYFIEAEKKSGQAATALDWVLRALVINPEHIDLAIRQADLLGMLERHRQAVHVLERLRPLPECPVFVDQWLGYYLLFLPGREEQAIRCSSRYLADFPESNESRRNLACAYAQKFCQERANAGGPLNHHSASYKEAMRNLRIVVRDNPGYLPTIREKWTAPPSGPFTCFLHDAEFRRIVELPPFVPVKDTLPESQSTAQPHRSLPTVQHSATDPVTIGGAVKTHEPAME